MPCAICSRSQQVSILVGERDDVAIGVDPRRPPRIDQEHQGEEAGDLGVVGQLRVDHRREPDRLVRQVDPLELASAAAGVPLVEDQVEDVEHGPHRRRLARRGRGVGTRRRTP